MVALAPAAGVGVLLLALALVRGGRSLGYALGLAGAIYVGAIVDAGRKIDATAPLVAVLLLLCGELAAWSVDERYTIPSDEPLGWRRAAAVTALGLAGLAAAALVLVLGAVPGGHGLVWTAAGALAAAGATGAGIWLAWR